MAKYKLQELNDLRDEGKRRVYPKMVTNRTLSRKEFVKMMQNYHRGISESTTEAVLTDVVDMLTDMLSMGYNVNLEGFGTFSLSLAFEDEKPREILNPDDKMTYRKVGVKDINFKASPEFVKEVRRETGAAVLMISHDLHVVMAASDRVICLNGHICCEGTPRVVSTAPEYRALFGLGTQGALALYRHEHDHAHEDGPHHHHHDHHHDHNHA